MMKIISLLLIVFVSKLTASNDASNDISIDHIDHHQDYEVEEDSNAFNRDNRAAIFKIIVPGTKWCGTGNISNDNHSLGPAKSTDRCCRTHDFCPDVIPAGGTKNNLMNTAFYSRLSCGCDQKFYNCLKASHDQLSNTVGTIYFNYLGTKCFRNDYPVVKCIKYHSPSNKRCVEYEYDKTKPKIFQWFEVPYY